MTWLMRDVDAIYGVEMEEYPADGELGLIRKMARVIRELVEVAQYVREPCDGCRCGECIAQRNLSSDAKELLDG